MPHKNTEEKFDLRTHATNYETHKSEAVNLYTAHIIKGIRYFERPINSGNVWYENNRPAGRISYDVSGSPVVNEREAHIAYAPPPSGSEKLAAELTAAKKAAAEAQAELAAIKLEQEARTAPKEADAPPGYAAPAKQKKG